MAKILHQYIVKSQCKVCNTIQTNFPESPSNKLLRKIENPIRCHQCAMGGKDSNCKILGEFDRKIVGKVKTDRKLT